MERCEPPFSITNHMLMLVAQIAEKTGRQDDIEELAARLIRLDNLINKTNQTMEERNA